MLLRFKFSRYFDRLHFSFTQKGYLNSHFLHMTFGSDFFHKPLIVDKYLSFKFFKFYFIQHNLKLLLGCLANSQELIAASQIVHKII